MNDYEYEMPDEFAYDAEDTEEDRERKLQAFSEWNREQAATSRAAAMQHIEVGDLYQPLLRFLHDDELDRMIALTIDMQRTLHREGHEAGQRYVMATLRVVLGGERTGRDNMAEQARIALESNGHEADVDLDRGSGWWVICSCEHCGEYRETRDEAIADGEAHFEEHGGGRWRHDLSD